MSSSAPDREGNGPNQRPNQDVNPQGDAEERAADMQVAPVSGTQSSRSSNGESSQESSSDTEEKEMNRLKRDANILSCLPDPMLAIDTDGSIIYANQRIEQLLQLPIQDLIGSDIEAYIALESIDGFRKMVRDAIEAKTPTAEHKASVDTDSSENAAPVAKRAKFSDDQAVASESKPIEVYTANVNTHQGEAEANLPTQKIQRHLGFGSTKQISTSATSSSPTGGTSSSPTERNQSMNSSSMQSSPSDKSKATNNSSESGYGASSSLGNISSRSDASDAVKGSAQKKTVQLNVALPPTLVICLLRKDNSKVWCEMTISARVKSFSDSISSDSSSKQSDKTGDMLELLLCFRPVTQGLSDSSDLTSSSNSRENGSRGSKGSNGTNGSQKDA